MKDIVIKMFVVGVLLFSVHLQKVVNEQYTLIDNLTQENNQLRSIPPDTIKLEKNFDRDWFLMKLALIKVESNFDSLAINQISKAGGLYQIMPSSGFLQEANRLINRNEYTDICRFSPDKSTEVFEILNQRYNPKKDLGLMCRLHNPSAGEWYKERIMKEYEFFKKISFQL